VVGSGTPTQDARGDDAITVASFNFPESVLLAEIYSQAIEGAGFRVEREAALGPRELVMPALLEGPGGVRPGVRGQRAPVPAGDGSTSPDHEINHERFAERLGRWTSPPSMRHPRRIRTGSR
jgi:Periplasmic glycine betaine/choline-binding (lipo)protein of an ABC-type transport system (osmoprotectant binding protein)